MSVHHPYDSLPPGYHVGGYEVMRVLGRGGFAYTYQVRKPSASGSLFAIKEWFPHGLVRRASNGSVKPVSNAAAAELDLTLAMFLQEAGLICGISHPNIVQGVEVFEAAGSGYLVMRYVTGRNLRESLRDPGGFRPDKHSLPRMTAFLLAGLQALHETGLLHCDIKPDNIFLGINHEPILIDMGSARRRLDGSDAAGVATYSRHFSAIEQLLDNRGTIGPWTDIYQLSAVLYRCMSGGMVPDAGERASRSTDPLLPLGEMPEVLDSYPTSLIRAVDRGLSLLPPGRPASVCEFALECGITIPPIRAAFTPPAPRMREPWPGPGSSMNTPRIPVVTPPEDPVANPENRPDRLLIFAAVLLLLVIFLGFTLLIRSF